MAISATAAPSLVVPVLLDNSREHRRLIANTVNNLVMEHGIPARYTVVPCQLRYHASAPSETLISPSNVRLPGFSDIVNQEMFWTATLPHSYIENSPFIINVRWTPTDSQTGIAVWGIECFADDLDHAWSSATGAAKSSTAVGTIQATRIPILTLSGMAISSVVCGRVYRNAAESGDTYPAPAGLISVDLLLLIDARGSQDEYAKHRVTEG